MDLVELLGLDDLLAWMILAVGLAMLLGNGFAAIQARRGRRPKGETGDFRPGRAYWLIAVGAVISVWGAASLIT